MDWEPAGLVCPLVRKLGDPTEPFWAGDGAGLLGGAAPRCLLAGVKAVLPRSQRKGGPGVALGLKRLRSAPAPHSPLPLGSHITVGCKEPGAWRPPHAWPSRAGGSGSHEEGPAGVRSSLSGQQASPVVVTSGRNGRFRAHVQAAGKVFASPLTGTRVAGDQRPAGGLA